MGTASIVLTPIESALLVAIVGLLVWIFNRVILKRLNEVERKLEGLSSKYASKEDFQTFREEALAALARIEDRIDKRLSDIQDIEMSTASKVAGVQAIVDTLLKQRNPQ